MRPASLIVLLLVLAVAAAAPVGVRAQDEDPVETIAAVPAKGRLALVKAAAARKDGRFDEAVSVLQKVVDEHPEADHFLVRSQLGSSLVLAGRDADALIHFRRATDMEPRHAESWLGLGQVAYAEGQYAEAGAALERGFRLTPDAAPDILYYAGVSHLMAANASEAARILEELVSLRHDRPELDWFRALVSACVDLKDARRGERAVSAVLKLFPDDPQAWHLAFQHAASCDDLRRAAVALTIKGYLAPLDEQEQVQLGDLYRVIDVPAKAAEYYAAALGDAPASEDYEQLAAAYLAAHEHGEAERVLQEALEAAPTLRLWTLLGDLKSMDKDHAGAYDAYAECSVLDPEYGRAWLMMGYCALEMNRYDDARSKLRRAVEFDEQRDSARRLLEQVNRLEERRESGRP